MNTEPQWECFADLSYYDMWAVRHKARRQFNEAIHVNTEKEARFLVRKLNELDRVKQQLKQLKCQE